MELFRDPSSRLHGHAQQSRSRDSEHGAAAREGAGLRLALPSDSRAPRLARAALRQFAHDRGAGSAQAATLTLLASELVSNAVRHSGMPPDSEIRLRASQLHNGALRVEVLDCGCGFEPALSAARAPGADGGYGLFLLAQQASRWGCEVRGGTCVWFELDA